MKYYKTTSVNNSVSVSVDVCEWVFKNTNLDNKEHFDRVFTQDFHGLNRTLEILNLLSFKTINRRCCNLSVILIWRFSIYNFLLGEHKACSKFVYLEVNMDFFVTRTKKMICPKKKELSWLESWQ